MKLLLLGFGGRAAALALAGVLAFATVVTGAATALALAIVLALAVMLGLFVRLHVSFAGVSGSERLGRESSGIKTGHGCCCDEETSGFVHLIWDFSFRFSDPAPAAPCRQHGLK